jgi:hypothetical protein
LTAKRPDAAISGSALACRLTQTSSCGGSALTDATAVARGDDRDRRRDEPHREAVRVRRYRGQGVGHVSLSKMSVTRPG